jgi:FtsP/CotA-like multicopper oxidase with cupredoxin domain
LGGRAEFVLDFSRWPSGTELYLVNVLAQRDGRGPAGTPLPVERGMRVLKLIVDGTRPTHGDPSRVPGHFFDLPAVDRGEVLTERTFVLGRASGGWSVNGKPLDPGDIAASPRLGSAEIWNFVNDSGSWRHDVHVPLETHQVLARSGVGPAPAGAGAPAAADLAREDLVSLGPGESVKTFRRFRDFVGRYPTRCADPVHEDHALMFMWKVTA